MLQYTVIYLAAICIQPMPVNISLGLWTISVMEEAGKGSYGRRAEFLPPLHGQLKSGARWSAGVACSAYILSPHIESCTPWCGNNHHNTQGIINGTVVFRYHRLTCVQLAQPWAKYKALTAPECTWGFFVEVCRWLKTYFAKSTYKL